MIVKNEDSRFLGIPVITVMEKERIMGEPVDLPPGYSEVADAKWALARPHVERLLNLGTIKEEWVKCDAKDAEKYALSIASDNGAETTKRLVPAKLQDIDRKGNKVINVIKETYDLKTLQKWYEEDLRQDVRIEIQNQITKINSGELKE